MPTPAGGGDVEVKATHAKLLAHLDGIDEIRERFEAGKFDERQRVFYRDTEQLLAHIHETIALKTADLEITNAQRVSSTLWNLLLGVNQEQRLVYEVFQDDTVNSAAFRELMVRYRQERYELDELHYLARLTNDANVRSLVVESPLIAELNELRAYLERSFDRSELITRLISDFGLGGVRSAYEKFLKTPASPQLRKFHQHSQNTQQLLRNLRKLDGDDGFKQVISRAEDTLNTYQNAVPLFIDLNFNEADNGAAMQPLDLDLGTLFDDLTELTTLEKVDQSHWFELLVSRAAELRDAALTVNDQINDFTQQRASDASDKLVSWLAFIAFVFITSVLVMGLISRNISKRVSRLNRALQYIIESYDFKYRIPDQGKDEIGLATDEFNRLVGHLDDQYEVQEKHREELQSLVSDLENKQHLIDHDLELAQQVFAKIVHAGSADLESVNFWNQPMTDFSGDMVLAEKSQSGFTYIMMCDFTGHGLPAALGALPVSTVFYPMARKDCAVSDIVFEINEKLRTLLPTSYFCCASIMVMDRNRQSCIYWNGGLPPLLHYAENGELKATLTGDHIPLGIMPYELKDAMPQEIILAPGDCIYAYTDGLTEADNPTGEMYTEERLRQALNLPLTQDGRIPIVRANLESFVQDHPAGDDITILEMVA